MSDDNIIDMLDRLNPALQPQTDSEETPSGEPGYQAWVENLAGIMPLCLYIYEKNQESSFIPYAHIRRGYVKEDTFVGIKGTAEHVELYGHHLDELLTLIGEHKITSLHCWDANKWPKPDDDTPIITDIVWAVGGE